MVSLRGQRTPQHKFRFEGKPAKMGTETWKHNRGCGCTHLTSDRRPGRLVVGDIYGGFSAIIVLIKFLVFGVRAK